MTTSECFDAWSRATVASWQQEETAESGDPTPFPSSDARGEEARDEEARGEEARELASGEAQWDDPGGTDPGGTDPGGRPLVLRAVHDGALVGVLIGHRSGHVGVIQSGIVAPDQRRHGIARHLLGAFVSAMADQGASQVSAWAPAGSPGEHWLRASGFEQTHARDHRLHLVRVLHTGKP
ncbi:MAG: GNAT family N-acetyltransferase [Actinobacteria bacterium]|nr:GNAT family N-acetyltransferase [Actinomycetota bacterium]